MTFFKTTVQEQIKSKTNWMELGSSFYVIDYSKFAKGLETELEAESKSYAFLETVNGIQFQDKRSKNAYENNIEVLAQFN